MPLNSPSHTIADLALSYGMAYESPLDGRVMHVSGTSHQSVVFSELRRAGEMIRALREEVEQLKAKVS